MNKKLSLVNQSTLIERKEQTREELNLDYIQRVANKLKLEKQDLIALINVLKLRIDSRKASAFLSKIQIFRPEVIQEAMFNFYHKRKVDHKNPNASMRQFFRFVADSDTIIPEEEIDEQLNKAIDDIGTECANIDFKGKF